MLDKCTRVLYNNKALRKPVQTTYADLAHLVERHLAKVEVASSSLVIRSIFFMQVDTFVCPPVCLPETVGFFLYCGDFFENHMVYAS